MTDKSECRPMALKATAVGARARAVGAPSLDHGTGIAVHRRRSKSMVTRIGSARYEGLGKDGKGFVSTQSGILDEQRYGFGSRFENEPGTNPEELIAAAHAACFTMALGFALAKEGFSDGTLRTEAKVTLEKEGDGFRISRSDLRLEARVPGIDEARFGEIARGAKAGCPVSKLLNAEIGFDYSLSG
jgi:lipoyl-dependent peroxiredoxin